MEDVIARWKNFGKALHIKPAKLQNIEAIPNIKPEECLGKTLTEFLNMAYEYETYGVPSWKLIVIALAHTTGGNNPQLALKVAGEHGATISKLQSAVCSLLIMWYIISLSQMIMVLVLHHLPMVVQLVLLIHQIMLFLVSSSYDTLKSYH